MDLNPNDPDSWQRNEAIDRFGGSLVNVILGALILWVGQTTFRHAGLLASVDERFESVGHQFEATDSRHEMLRQRVERVTSDTAERTRSRFTREDAEKMATRIKELRDRHTNLERQFSQRLTELQLKVIALETHGSNHQEVAMLRDEVQRLRAQSGTNYRSVSAAAKPTYLPPITQTR
ncbi:MAG: hypothetical protein AAGD11_14990 [Planctomycetota bacterium]